MKIKTGLLTIVAVKTAALLAYAFIARPRLLRWGATDEEVNRTLPGDEFIERPRYVTTRAVNIHAPAGVVWAWLVQMGQGRGGFYSYDWLENKAGLDIHSAETIVPELQDLKVGDTVRLTPEESATTSLVMEVAILETERALVLRAAGTMEEAFDAGLPYATWAFLLEPVGEATTRLVVRLRTDFKPTPAGLMLNKYCLEIPHFVMERKTMLGIKERAENTPAEVQKEAA